MRTVEVLTKSREVLNKLNIHIPHKGAMYMVHKYIAQAHAVAHSLSEPLYRDFETVYNWAYEQETHVLESLLPCPLHVDTELVDLLFNRPFTENHRAELVQLGFIDDKRYGSVATLYDFVLEIRRVDEEAFNRLLVSDTLDLLTALIVYYKEYRRVLR